ncbi:MAG: ankyrin repeat domain-containing protein [Planctomycetia bacterium]|nr:ankyrin repeat domain-containing protein [Planctomycetia bacterium]
MECHSRGANEILDQVSTAFCADNAAEVRRLLDENPSLKARIDEPLGPFDAPAIVNVRSREMLDALLDAGANLDAKSKWWAGGFGLLHSASPELAAYAIQRGAVVDVHAAARLGLIDRLGELVSAEPALVHARGGDGQTPLHFARTIEVAEYLLEHGAEIDARDVDHESTAAQWMTDERHELARVLIDRGCRADLLLASAVGDIALAKRLLDADPEAIRARVNDDCFPKTDPRSGGTIYQWTLGFHVSPHQVARKFGHDDLFQFLWERSPATVKLLTACWLGDEARAHAMRTEHPGVTAELTAAEQRNVAHAARNNETAAVRLFLECGLPVDTCGQHHATPLHWAAFHGNLGMAQALLCHSPPLEATDADFHGTPLGWAIHGSEHGWYAQTGDYAATVDALLQAGARPPAQQGGSLAVREALRRHGT